MSDKSSILHFPSGKNASYLSPLFHSPKLFVGHSKAFVDSEVAMSPTSILETKPFSSVSGNSFRKPYHGNGDSSAIGLGLVDALTKENTETIPFSPRSRLVLFGSQLKVQIPQLQSNSSSPTGSVESPLTPIEFGINNKSSQLALLSPSVLGCEVHSSSPKPFSGCLSSREMELSEDYTCVISYGPNPKKTHIFDNCVVESCGDGFPMLRRDGGLSKDRGSENFLSFCHACKKSLAHGKDIFMYRGEWAFCSRECRQLEMLSDGEGAEDCFHGLLDRF